MEKVSTNHLLSLYHFLHMQVNVIVAVLSKNQVKLHFALNFTCAQQRSNLRKKKRKQIRFQAECSAGNKGRELESTRRQAIVDRMKADGK